MSNPNCDYCARLFSDNVKRRKARSRVCATCSKLIYKYHSQELKTEESRKRKESVFIGASVALTGLVPFHLMSTGPSKNPGEGPNMAQGGGPIRAQVKGP